MECQHYPALHFLIYSHHSHHSQPWFQESLQSSLFAPWSSMLCLRGRGNRWGGPGEPRGHGTQLGLSGGGRWGTMARSAGMCRDAPGCEDFMGFAQQTLGISWGFPSLIIQLPKTIKDPWVGSWKTTFWGRFGMASGCVLRMPIPVLSRSERSLRSQHSNGTLLLGRLRTHTEEVQLLSGWLFWTSK